MPISVIQWEVHDRPVWRWVCMVVLLLWLVIFSLRKTDWIWVLFLAIFVWIYAWFQRKDEHEQYSFDLSESWITLWPKFYARETIEWFSIGYKISEKELHTLHLYTDNKESHIFTFVWSQWEIKEIAEVIASMKPLVSTPRFTSAQKLMRFMRL